MTIPVRALPPTGKSVGHLSDFRVGPGHSRDVLVTCLVLASSVACQSGERDACEELHSYFTEGLILSSDPAECTRYLAFVRGPIVREWPTPQDWLDEVVRQRVRLMGDMIDSWVEEVIRSEVDGRIPSQVPCGRGVTVTDRLWRDSGLADLGVRRPDRLFVSLGLSVLERTPDGDHLVIRSFQDFDCDGVVAFSEMEGIARVGQPVLGGGWNYRRNKFAPLDE